MNRRSFLKGIVVAGAAPAVILTPGLLMPVRAGWSTGLVTLPNTYPRYGVSVTELVTDSQDWLNQEFLAQYEGNVMRLLSLRVDRDILRVLRT